MLTIRTPAVATGSREQVATAAGVEFRWSIEGEWLHGCMCARTMGWIAVGFNDRPTLAGARLLMGRVVNGTAAVEVHRAHPPGHSRIAGSERNVKVQRCAPQPSRTCIGFAMRLDPTDASDVRLVAGAPTHIVLAWSHEPGFDHHSAERAAIDARL
jgi:hypothetical protein